MMAACYCMTLRREGRALTAFYDQALKGSGLKVTQFALLYHLLALEPAELRVLSEALALERTTLMRNLALLEKQGLAARARRTGRRSLLVELTESGRDALARARPLWEKAQAEVERVLSREEIALLEALAARLGKLA